MNGRGVSETLWHYAPFICPKRCANCHFLNTLGMHTCLVEAVSEINRAPDFTFATICENVIDNRHLVLIWNRVLVQLSIVANPTWERHWVSLGDNEGWQCELQAAGLNEALSEVEVN